MPGNGMIESLGSTPPQKAVEAEQADELFEMANLFPRTTGLPMTVWVSPRGKCPAPVAPLRP